LNVKSDLIDKIVGVSANLHTLRAAID